MRSSFSFPLRYRRGQAGITDLFIAVAIFIVLVTITTLIWNLYNARLESRLDYDTIVLKTYAIVDALVKSPGSPERWELVPDAQLSGVLQVGLAEQDHVIDEAKITRFAQLADPAFSGGTTYDTLRDVLKIGLYQFYFVLKDAKKQNVFVSGQLPQGKFAVNLARIVMYRGKPHILEFTVWKK